MHVNAWHATGEMEDNPKVRPTMLEVTSKLKELPKLEFVPGLDAQNVVTGGSSMDPTFSRFDEPIAVPFKFFT